MLISIKHSSNEIHSCDKSQNVELQGCVNVDAKSVVINEPTNRSAVLIFVTAAGYTREVKSKVHPVPCGTQGGPHLLFNSL